ncbi:hypothetical protein EV182_004113 [Spiromyces aspiralis]|uniref:Uncharacterized protein n=1 Tax=Spiromyces aspiralis TaxID=68401 RepID=A0ACC1HPH6_9FUNG|nr:hypothetical protein EV182_004113 [Spiromyces aspiralis]
MSAIRTTASSIGCRVAQPLTDKVALVTGSSRSIGAAIAQRLADDGARVIVNYRSDSAGAASVCAGINDRHGDGTAVTVQGDASTVIGAQAIVHKSLQAFGSNKLDIVVLNAGVGDYKPLAEATEEQFDYQFNTNVKGPVFLVKALEPHLVEGGRVAFLSSAYTLASRPSINVLFYLATNGAIEQIMRVLARDLGRRMVTVNAVAPGIVANEKFYRTRDPSTDSGRNEVEQIAKQSPMNDLCKPQNVASVVAFLAGPDSRWISGQVIYATGASDV